MSIEVQKYSEKHENDFTYRMIGEEEKKKREGEENRREEGGKE